VLNISSLCRWYLLDHQLAISPEWTNYIDHYPSRAHGLVDLLLVTGVDYDSWNSIFAAEIELGSNLFETVA
jgi:hypothetical protein